MNKALKVRKHFIVLAVVILLQSSLVSLASGMSDVEGHWAEREIHYAIEENWMGGYSDTAFGVNVPLSRAEMAVVLSRVLNIPAGHVSFTDVSSDHWAASSISAVAEAGLMGGYPDQSFSPEGQISREELAATLVRAFPLPMSDTSRAFSDISSDRWSFEAVHTLTANGIIVGYPDGTFQPTQSVTRAELAAILKRIVIDEPDETSGELNAIRDQLNLGMTQDEAIAALGEDYAVVAPAAAPIPGQIWRYDVGTSSDYRFESSNDAADLDGLRNRDVSHQVFLTWTENEQLDSYTIVYFEGDGIYEYRVYADGETETNRIR